MLNPSKGSRGIGKITVIFLILIVGASIYLVKKLGKPYFAYYDLQKTMRYWIEMSLNRSSYDHANLTKNVMDTIRKHNIPLKEGDLKIEYNREERHLRISAQYKVAVKLPGYIHILYFRPSAEHKTTALL
jgi:hypothetical protein